MNLSDEELDHVHSLLYGAVYYPNVGYFNEEQMKDVESALSKVTDEAKRRKLW